MKNLKLFVVLFLTLSFVTAQAQEEAVPSSGFDPSLINPDTDIFSAAILGDIEALRRHLDAGVPINSVDPTFSASVLAATALRNQLGAAKFLLSQGADPNQASPDGNTPLHTAAFLGYPTLAMVLIEAGANLFAPGSGGTPYDILNLDWETTSQVAAMLQLDVNEQMVMTGRRSIRAMFDVEIARLAKEDPYLATFINDASALTAALNTGKDLNAVDPGSGMSILTIAVRYANAALLGQLIGAGADPNVVNNDGGTALHTAVFFGKADMVELLLEAGADTSAFNGLGASVHDIVNLDMETTAYYAGMLNIEIDALAVMDGRAKIREMLGTAEPPQ